MARRLTRAASCLAAVLLSGCSLAPKNFKAIHKPEPLVRARAIPLGRKLPEQKVVPNLIDSLADRDQVVRMTASEELKKRSGKDFGFVPYAEPEERATAISRWRAWWASQPQGFGNVRRKRILRNSTDAADTQ